MKNCKWILPLLLLAGALAADADAAGSGRIRVSENGRFLQHADGTPFFYLGDTAWELFHRLGREEADLYLRNRAQKGYTVIQAVVLGELDGVRAPNALGEKPFFGDDPSKPNEAYFNHVDYVVDLAAAYGLVIGLLPTWGDKIMGMGGAGPRIFDEVSAERYGLFLGRRYAERENIIWVLGGDRPCEETAGIWRAMARGITVGVAGHEDYSRTLMTYHPPGGGSSARCFHDDPWLDFNMRQNGHCDTTPVWDLIGEDYDRTPVKPVLDGEPLYEEHPICFNRDKFGTSTDYHVRRFLYHDLFAGAFGHTYGCHAVWQMAAPDKAPVNKPLRPWFESINLPGAFQMQWGRALMVSRPYFSRIPDPGFVVSPPGDENRRVSATRDGDGSWAMVYSEQGYPFSVDLSRLSGEKVTGWWFDPRDGRADRAGEFSGKGVLEFLPPSRGIGNDWVLVLDDASKNRPAPGSVWRRVSVPPAPVEVSVSDLTPVSAVLTWTPGPGPAEVLGHKIHVDGRIAAASVSGSARLTGLTPGTEYRVSVTAVGPGPSESPRSQDVFLRTLADMPVSAVEVEPVSVEMEAGQTRSIGARIRPAGVHFRKLTWRSSDPKVALVDADGLVRALRPGSAVVEARPRSGVKAGRCAVRVTRPASFFTVRKVEGTVEPDGLLSESCWSGWEKIEKTVEGGPDGAAEFGAVWDERNLYVAVRVTDPKIMTDSEQPWDDDALELFIDPDHSRHGSYDALDRQVVLGVSGKTFETRNDLSGIRYALVRAADGYTLEAAFSWAALGVKPESGALLGFDVQVDDDDDGGGRDGLRVWRGDNSNWSSTLGYGSFLLE